MTSGPGPCCLNCRYWHVSAVELERETQRMQPGVVMIRRSEFYACRRYPPAPEMRRPLPSDAIRAFWPQTSAADWCGEWVAREQAVST